MADKNYLKYLQDELDACKEILKKENIDDVRKYKNKILRLIREQK